MIGNNFWLLTLCALLIAAATFGLSIPLRIAIAANAVLILIGVVRRILDWRKRDAKE